MNHSSTPSARPLPQTPDNRELLTLAAAGILALVAVVVGLREAAGLAMAMAGAVFVVRVLDRPLIGVVLMISATALDITGRLMEIGGVAITLYQALTALTAVAFALAAKQRHAMPSASPMDLPVLAFLAMVVAGIPAALDPKLALVAAASLISSAVMLFLVVWIVRDVESARALILSIGIAGALLGALAVIERQGIYAVQGSYIELWRDGIRARATFKDPNILGAYLAAASLLSASWGIAERRLPVRLLSFGCSAAAAAGILSTLSRGAAGAWLLGVLVVILFSRLPVAWKVLTTAAIGFGIAFMIAFVLPPEWIEAKILGVTANQSALYRVWMARGSLQMFLDNPMGVGPGNFPVVFPQYREAMVRTTLVESHTAYITVLTETGVFGFLAFLWLLWRYFTRTALALRARNDAAHALAVGSLAAGVALCAQAFTYSLESSKMLWLVFGLGMVAYRLWSQGEHETVERGTT